MNVERFTHLLDAYGSDPKRWPAAERDEAMLLLQTSDVARGALLNAEQLDAVLSAGPALSDGFDAPSQELLRRVAEVPVRHPRLLERTAWWPFERAYASVLALAAAVMFGVFVGDLTFPADGGTVLSEGASELSEDDVDELAELAFASDISVGLGDDALSLGEEAGSGSEETVP
jgi:hypothetical protein